MKWTLLRAAVVAVLATLTVLVSCGRIPLHRSSHAGPQGPVPSDAVRPPVAAGVPGTVGRPDHVVIAVFENKTYGTVAGSRSAPYLNTVLKRAAVFTDAHGVTHPSQPNYLALFSGSTHGVTSDRCPVRLKGAPNLARQLLDAGLSFTGYSEDLPSAGFTGCSHAGYAAKHNPWADFDNVPASANQPYSAFPADFRTLPTVSFVVPNLCHDMHDCGVATGDAWARTHLDAYLRWAEQHNSLLIVTFDENDDSPHNQILTFVAGAGVRPGSYREPVDHYRVLRTLQYLYGLPPIGNSARTSPVTDIWH